jgi:hypothetical protein
MPVAASASPLSKKMLKKRNTSLVPGRFNHACRLCQSLLALHLLFTPPCFPYFSR